MNSKLPRINLSEKTRALESEIAQYWFENKTIGLKKTLFTRIVIPLKSFDSGSELDEQPVNTSFMIEWLQLPQESLKNAKIIQISSHSFPTMEASIYLGTAHNWCQIENLNIKRLSPNRFHIEGIIEIEFEREGFAQNERFEFATTASEKKP